MAGQNVSERLESKLFLGRLARPEETDFDIIPDLKFFKNEALTAYLESKIEEFTYLLKVNDKIGSFKITKVFGEQGNLSSMFKADAWRAGVLFRQDETCLLKGLLAPPRDIKGTPEDFEAMLENYARIYRAFYNERRIMYALRKKYVPNKEYHLALMVECNLDPTGGKPYIAMRYIPKKKLAQMEPYKGITPKEALIIMHDVSHALRMLNEEGGVCHGDVKPENMIFGADERAALIDLGSAAYMKKDPSHAFEPCTPVYISPEYARWLIRDEEMIKFAEIRPCTKTIHYDPYSFGVSMVELITEETTMDRVMAYYGMLPKDADALPLPKLCEYIYKYIAGLQHPLDIEKAMQNPKLTRDDKYVFKQINEWVIALTQPDPQNRITSAGLCSKMLGFFMDKQNQDLRKLIQPKKVIDTTETKIIKYGSQRIEEIKAAEQEGDTTRRLRIERGRTQLSEKDLQQAKGNLKIKKNFYD